MKSSGGEVMKIDQSKKAVEIKNLSKSFKIDNGDLNILNNINLSVNDGEFLSIIGSSGCGKSTLLRMIVGLDKDFSGSILSYGKPIIGPGVNRGMVFQEARLFPWLTVEKNIAFGISKKVSDSEKKI